MYVHTVGAIGGVLRELPDGIDLERIDDARKGRRVCLGEGEVMVRIRRSRGVHISRLEVSGGRVRGGGRIGR